MFLRTVGGRLQESLVLGVQSDAPESMFHEKTISFGKKRITNLTQFLFVDLVGAVDMLLSIRARDAADTNALSALEDIIRAQVTSRWQEEVSFRRIVAQKHSFLFQIPVLIIIRAGSEGSPLPGRCSSVGLGRVHLPPAGGAFVGVGAAPSGSLVGWEGQSGRSSRGRLVLGFLLHHFVRDGWGDRTRLLDGDPLTKMLAGTLVDGNALGQ